MSRNNRNLWSERSRQASETIGLGENKECGTKCRYNIGCSRINCDYGTKKSRMAWSDAGFLCVCMKGFNRRCGGVG